MTDLEGCAFRKCIFPKGDQKNSQNGVSVECGGVGFRVYMFCFQNGSKRFMSGDGSPLL